MTRLFTLLFVLSLAFSLQAAEPVSKKYLAGAVPVINGQVVFKKTFEVPGKTSAEIFDLVRNYVETELVAGPDHGPQARITECSQEEGILAASIQETLWFLRKPARSDFSQFYYQIVCQVTDQKAEITLRNLRYIYDMSDREQDRATYRAEEWITDKEALNKAGNKLSRMTGKFRRSTIDRKDAILQGIGAVLGAKKKTVIIEEY